MVSADHYKSPGDGFYVEEKERSGEQFPLEEDESGTYMFNAKDLCAVELLDDIRNAGVMSFKIEGRTKSAYMLPWQPGHTEKLLMTWQRGNLLIHPIWMI